MISPLSRLRDRRARIIADRLEAYGTAFGRYYRLAVKAGERLYLAGEPCPRPVRDSEVTEFDPEASRRQRRDQTQRGCMEAQMLGLRHGWIDAHNATEAGIDRLEAYASGNTIEVDDR